MFFLTRALTFVIPLSIFTLLELALLYYLNTYLVGVFLIISLLVLGTAIWFILGKQFNADLFYFTWISFLLLLSGIFFSVLLDGLLSRHLFLLILVIVLGIWLEVIFRHTFFEAYLHRDRIIDFMHNLNSFGFYLWVSALYGFMFFIDTSLTLASLLLVGIGILSTYILLSILGVSAWKNRLLTLVVIFGILELFLALNFLPIIFYIKSFILSLVYYFILDLLILEHRSLLTNRAFIVRLFFGVLGLLLILLTSRWV